MATSVETMKFKCDKCGEMQTMAEIQACAGSGSSQTARGSQIRRPRGDDASKRIYQARCPHCRGEKVHFTKGDAMACLERHNGLEFPGYMGQRLRSILGPQDPDTGVLSEGETKTPKLVVMTREGKSYKLVSWNPTKRGRPVTLLVDPRRKTTAEFSLFDVRFADEIEQILADQADYEAKEQAEMEARQNS
jgi:hypothetical protein